LSIFLPFYTSKTTGREKWQPSVELFNKQKRHDKKKYFAKGQTRDKKRQVGLKYSSHIYFPTIFCCDGDAPSKASSHRRAHLFQPNAPRSMLTEQFDGNRV